MDTAVPKRVSRNMDTTVRNRVSKTMDTTVLNRVSWTMYPLGRRWHPKNRGDLYRAITVITYITRNHSAERATCHQNTSYHCAEQFITKNITVQNRLLQRERPVAKFIVVDWGDKVNSGIELSYRSARLHWLAGLYDNPIRRSQLYPPVRNYEFGHSALCR